MRHSEVLYNDQRLLESGVDAYEGMLNFDTRVQIRASVASTSDMRCERRVG